MEYDLGLKRHTITGAGNEVFEAQCLGLDARLTVTTEEWDDNEDELLEDIADVLAEQLAGKWADLIREKLIGLLIQAQLADNPKPEAPTFEVELGDIRAVAENLRRNAKPTLRVDDVDYYVVGDGWTPDRIAAVQAEIDRQENEQRLCELAPGHCGVDNCYCAGVRR